jgi:hypothetical protein
MKSFLWRFAQVVFAYGAAVMVSCVFYLIVFGLTGIVKSPDKFLMALRELPKFYVIALILVAAFALPGWLLMIGLAGGPGKRRKSFYLKAGALNASVVPALLFLVVLLRGELTQIVISEGMAFCLIALVMAAGGVLAGWVYWRVAVIGFGRHGGQ